MALTATVYSFDVQLSDMDRGVYESLSFKAAQHPSESEEYFVTRVLAYCLEYADGIAFSKGLADPDEPAIVVRDLTGALRSWIEIGSPDADRLHKAAKASPRVIVYTHKDARRLLESLAGHRIHRRDDIIVVAPGRELVTALCDRLERRMAFALSVTEGHVYISIGDETLEGTLTSHALAS